MLDNTVQAAQTSLRFFSFFFCSLLLSNLQVGTAGGWSVVGSRVQRGKEGLLTLCRWVGAVVCSAPTGLAGQLSWSFVFCLDGYRGALVFPEPAKGKTKLGFDLRSKFRLARRIESDQIGVDQTGQKGPFLDPLSV